MHDFLIECFHSGKSDLVNAAHSAASLSAATIGRDSSTKI